ncbi:MAG: protein kinase, partial [Candidatus Adiutrix sp.]|nr:protein kinase [Candidatus Adiutrix sp.]
PNLVNCKRVITLMGHPVIIMEYIEGSDLARLMTGAQSHNFYRGRQPGPFARLMDTFIQVARGLKYAHSIGLMRLDVKPRNILLETGGRALLSDYGPLSGGLLQKIRQTAGPEFGQGQLAPKANPALTNTSTGQVMGTYQYFSPETINGRPSQGAGADLWALSLTILECFLGYRPWEIGSLAGQGLDNYLRTIQQKVPIPPPLAEYFRKALADNPLDRHQTAAEMEEELLAVYAEVTKRPYSRPAPEAAPETAEQRLARTDSLKALGLSAREAAVLARPALTLVSG